MGEGLVIKATITSAKEILRVIKDPELLYWEERGHHLDVLAKWLPDRGFKILPKFFDKDYKLGTVDDEADKLWEEACKDFVPRLWKLDRTTKLGDLKKCHRL